MATYMQGAIKSGDDPSEVPSGVGVGTVVLSQTSLINFVAVLYTGGSR